MEDYLEFLKIWVIAFVVIIATVFLIAFIISPKHEKEQSMCFNNTIYTKKSNEDFWRPDLTAGKCFTVDKE
jgi:hypothetical protein